MMTRGRFAALAESYGADLARWPEEERAAARAFAVQDPEAPRLLAEAAELDALLAASRRAAQAASWRAAEETAALARLRERVAEAIAAPPAAGLRRGTRSGAFAAFRARLEWFGMATGGGLLVASGGLLGYLSVSPGAADSLMAVLQPGPIHFLVF